MRVQLDTGSRSVDLEDSESRLYSWEMDDAFIELVLDALQSIGYTRGDVLKIITRGDNESS